MKPKEIFNAQFLKEAEKLRKQNDFTFTDEDGKVWTGDAAIARHFGMSTIGFRQKLAFARYAKREFEKMGFTFIPCENSPNGRYYIELPDGYRLIYDNNGYVGRHDPNLSGVI